jgi:plastocyanin
MRSRGGSIYAGRLCASPILIVTAHFRRFVLAVVSLFAIASWACAGEILNVEIFDKPPCFRPANPTVKVGTTVKWINKGETVHTVTADPSQAPDPSWVVMPPGAEEMDSGYMSVGDSFSYDFKVPGVYKYFCLTHEQEGMRGEINVEK